MKKVIIGLLIALCSSGHALGQKITMVNATRQEWSGGIAGHYGTNYAITIKAEDSVKLDSLYISNMGTFNRKHSRQG